MKLLKKTQQSTPSRRQNSGQGRERATADDLGERYAFRRNRTLTGSLSSRVVSANEHRSELKSSRVQAHDLKKHRRRLLLILGAVLIAVLSLFYLVFQSVATVKVVTTDGRTVTERYEKAIQTYLGQRPAERFRFSLDTARLSSYLQTNGYPEVRSVSSDMSVAGFGRTELQLQVRKPVVSWRTNESELFVDSSGSAFAYNYYQKPAVQVVDQSGIEASNSQVLASNRFLRFIGLVVGSMEAQGYAVIEVSLPSGTARQLQVKVRDTAYPIKFSVDRSAGEQSEDAARAMRHFASQGVTPEYLDVRVSGKAYYK